MDRQKCNSTCPGQTEVVPQVGPEPGVRSDVALGKQPGPPPRLPPQPFSPLLTSCSRCRRGVPQKRKRGSGTGRKTGSGTSCRTGWTWAGHKRGRRGTQGGAGTPEAGSPPLCPHAARGWGLALPSCPRASFKSGLSSSPCARHPLPASLHPAPKPARDLAEQIELGGFVFVILDGQGQHLLRPAEGRA